ncbi:hypothetical protein DIPPA_16846 [Diplonema papillatum]|nr:hypothetical protein DIPPA_16846 [Diplonema papillatum]
MKTMLVLVLLCMASAASAQRRHPRQPTPWPNSFTSTLTENQTSPDGSQVIAFLTMKKQYDYSRNAVRVSCSLNDATSVFLAIGQDGYVWNIQNEACRYVFLPVNRVTPDWMVGGVFVGSRVISGADSWCYDKADHIYCQSKATRQPTYVFAPFNQNGFSITDTYNVWVPNAIPNGTFSLPPYCSKPADYNTTDPHPFGSKALCPNPPPAADPTCCFIQTALTL